MKRIITRIETKQIELLQANEEITKGSKCYKDYLFVDVLGDEFVAYPNPEAAIADLGRMVSDILYDENYPECNGEICFCVNVVVDAYRRDNDEPSFSACEKNEVSDLIFSHRKKQEAEADKEGDGFTRIEGAPFKIEKVVFHNAGLEKPQEHQTVVLLTDKGYWFLGSYKDDRWKYATGGVFDAVDTAGDVIAWFQVPTLQKVDK